MLFRSFSAPTTANDTLPRYLSTGRVEPRRSVPTLANAMDVGNPSNLERLQWLFGGDVAAARAVVRSHACSDDDVRRGVRALYDTHAYVADPHTAIGYLGCDPTEHCVFLATAHPAKFREVVEPIVGTPVFMPDALAATLARERVVQHISPSLRELSALL